MMNFTNDYLPVLIAILLSTLVLYGFWKLINNALPGDRAIKVILGQIRAMEAHQHQQSRQTIDDLAKLAQQEYQINAGRDKREDDPAGIRPDNQTSISGSHEIAQSKWRYLL